MAPVVGGQLLADDRGPPWVLANRFGFFEEPQPGAGPRTLIMLVLALSKLKQEFIGGVHFRGQRPHRR